uniref:BURP domain protein USPL1-like n=1 Tax=Elaeis guineensis var. tenera TaxID=51953 RepID=A0A8N4F5Q2_ELAGV|nr:BURP domain protein USPL1-like [Elaeis guineensis]
MVGKDGTKVEAVAACHTDTDGFNPEHVAFKVLNVKPGTVPICQFQPQNDIVWSPNTLSISPLEMVVENYAYAVFHCHTACAEAYKVSMVGKDGTKVEAVAACHTDTAGFNPEHVAFKVLNVKPGTVPICQFQPQNDIVWSPNTLSISPLEMVV